MRPHGSVLQHLQSLVCRRSRVTSCILVQPGCPPLLTGELTGDRASPSEQPTSCRLAARAVPELWRNPDWKVLWLAQAQEQADRASGRAMWYADFCRAVAARRGLLDARPATPTRFLAYLPESGSAPCQCKAQQAGRTLCRAEVSLRCRCSRSHRRSLHHIHHQYNKQDALSPFAGLAFHPLDGIMQARTSCFRFALTNFGGI